MSPAREPLPPRPRPGESASGAGPVRGSPVDRPPLPTDPAGLPPLPERFHDVLRDGLATMGLDLSRTQLHALDAYVRLLLAWTDAINLTAIREPAAVARDHLLDSLSAVALLRETGARRILDLGSGGGLPGIPIGIALPAAHVLLVESIAKKAAFLRTAVRAIGADRRIEVAAERAEALASPGRGRDSFDAVTVRGVAGLPELIELSFPLLRIGGQVIAWKREPQQADIDAGREPLHRELAAGRNAARVLGGELDIVPVTVEGLEHHRLVVVAKRRATPVRFPRSPGERRAEPLGALLHGALHG